MFCKLLAFSLWSVNLGGVGRCAYERTKTHKLSEEDQIDQVPDTSPTFSYRSPPHLPCSTCCSFLARPLTCRPLTSDLCLECFPFRHLEASLPHRLQVFTQTSRSPLGLSWPPCVKSQCPSPSSPAFFFSLSLIIGSIIYVLIYFVYS